MNRGVYNAELFQDKIDFSLLACALPGKMGMSDIDGVMERRGNFLWFESKATRKQVTRGQSILFTALVRRGDTVIWLYGPNNQWTEFEVWYPTGQDITFTSYDHLLEVIKEWWEFANETK